MNIDYKPRVSRKESIGETREFITPQGRRVLWLQGPLWKKTPLEEREWTMLKLLH